MNQAFANKTGKIVVVEPSGAVRQLLMDVLRSKNFESMNGVASIKDAMGILEVEPVDWIITPLFEDQEYNALQLLSIVTKYPTLKQVRMTLLLEEREKPILCDAYELGLLNHFEKPFNKTSLSEVANKFFTVFEENKWVETRVAAYYLNEYLKELNFINLQNTLFKNLLQFFPGDIEYMMELSRVLSKQGNTHHSKVMLKQAKLLSSDPQKILDLEKELFPPAEVKEGEEAPLTDEDPINALDLKTVVVVEPDTQFKDLLVECLKGVGVEKVEAFADGEECWKWMEDNEEPNLVVCEWRIPKLSGPYLVQRIRHRFPCMPLIVTTSLIGKDDLPLVKEMGVACVVEKPYEKHVFIKNLIFTVQQERLPSSAETLETKIKQNLEGENLDEAYNLRERYMQLTEIPDTRKKKIEAEFAFIEGKFKKARDLTVEAIRTEKDSINLLNLLGKCLMKLQDFNSAIKCFEKAQTMSPMNLQRLCTIAEVNTELGNKAEADKALQEAQKKDGGSEQVAEASAEIAFTNGNIDQAKEIMGKLNSLSKIISYMNNKAVAQARGGNVEASFDLYQKTINSIPDDRTEIKGLVSYNLALAYARLDRSKDCIETLDKVLAFGDTKVTLKAKSLKTRVEYAVARGAKILLKVAIPGQSGTQNNKPEGEETENDETQTEEIHKAIVANLQINQGDVCCFKIFFAGEGSDQEKSKKMLGTNVRFNPRKAISREMTSGAEKTLKQKSKEESTPGG